MANSANRPIDFAPAWLKLPDQSQERKQEIPTSHHQQHLRKTGGLHSNVSSYFTAHQNPPSYQTPHPFHHQHSFNGPSSARHNRLNSHGNFDSRPHISNKHHLHRSQSDSGYNENSHRSELIADPLGEDFPVLNSAAVSHSASSTAQWRLKATSDNNSREDNSHKSGHGNALTSNMSGKVWRAQVKPIKRSNKIPITNGRSVSSKAEPNGDAMKLSSSVEKEKKLLQMMGWQEEDGSDDDECGIPEQDPRELEEIFMKAKAARERLLMKSRQTLKPTNPMSAIIPNDDELPSSSENSDAE